MIYKKGFLSEGLIKAKNRLELDGDNIAETRHLRNANYC